MPSTMKRRWSDEGAFVALVSIYIENSTHTRATIGPREERRDGGASKTRDGEDKGGQERQEKGWLRG